MADHDEISIKFATNSSPDTSSQINEEADGNIPNEQSPCGNESSFVPTPVVRNSVGSIGENIA